MLILSDFASSIESRIYFAILYAATTPHLLKLVAEPEENFKTPIGIDVYFLDKLVHDLSG